MHPNKFKAIARKKKQRQPTLEEKTCTAPPAHDSGFEDLEREEDDYYSQK